MTLAVLLAACGPKSVDCGTFTAGGTCASGPGFLCLRRAYAACVPAHAEDEFGRVISVLEDCSLSLALCEDGTCSDPEPCESYYASCDSVREAGQPDVAFDPVEYDFGEVPVGETRVLDAAVVNDGFSSLRVFEIRLSEQEESLHLSTLSTTLIPACESASFTVTFEPSERASLRASVFLDSDDLDTPTAELPVSGLGWE